MEVVIDENGVYHEVENRRVSGTDSISNGAEDLEILPLPIVDY